MQRNPLTCEYTHQQSNFKDVKLSNYMQLFTVKLYETISSKHLLIHHNFRTNISKTDTTEQEFITP